MGGVERRLVAIMPKLIAKGYDMKVVCTREYGTLTNEMVDIGVPVERIRFNSRLDPKALWKLRSRFVRNRTLVVHSHMYRPSVSATVAAKLAGVPAVFCQFHNIDTWKSARQIRSDRKLAKFRDGMICVSAAVQENVCSNLGVPSSKTPILYNGVDVDFFRPDDEGRKAVRKELEIPDEQPLVVIPARLHPQKLPLEVLDAFLKIRDKIPSQPILAYAGPGKLEEQLRQAVQEKNASGYVKVMGRRDDIKNIYNAADLILLSSLKEGFSNAIIEALACGKPVLAANVGGNAEALTQPEYGWLHEPCDMETMKKQLVEALTDWKYLRNRADACRKRSLQFSLDAMVEETDKLYRSTLERKGKLPK